MSFGSNKREKVLLIDGSNLFASAKAIHLDLDYIKLRDVFGKNALHVIYYTALPPDGENSTLRPLLDLLQFNGYLLVTKTWKRFFDPELKTHRIKGNMDIEMAVDAMDLSSHSKDMVFFTGDGDFAPLLRNLQNKGVHCTVVSTLCSNYDTHSMIADELRKQANQFIDLESVRERIVRDAEIPIRTEVHQGRESHRLSLPVRR